MQLFNKNNANVFVSTNLFIGCFVFVVYRGYLCFDKYFKKPENSKVSFESNRNQPFPSFTICHSENASYNNDQMKECQLELFEYVDQSQWIGKGDINCTDPKLLHNQVAANSEDLEIAQIRVLTYASNNQFYIQPSHLDWKLAHHSAIHPQRCFTFSIPDCP